MQRTVNFSFTLVLFDLRLRLHFFNLGNDYLIVVVIMNNYCALKLLCGVDHR